MRVRLVRQVVEVSHDGTNSVSRVQHAAAELRFERQPPLLRSTEIAGAWQVAEELTPEAPDPGERHAFVAPEDASVGPTTTCVLCHAAFASDVHAVPAD